MEKNKNEYCIQTNEWYSEILTSRYMKYPDITVKTVKDFDSIVRLTDLWNNIVLNSSRATIYQTFEWLYNWWNFFAAKQNNSLHILLILSSGKLAGIAPFYVHNHSFGGFQIYRQLKLIGDGLKSGMSHSSAIEDHGVSDYLDIIVLDGYEKKVADTIVSYLHEFKNLFDEIDFQNVSEESFISEWLLTQLQIKNFRTQLLKTDTCPRLRTPNSINIYLESLKASTRRKCRQIQNQTEGFPVMEIIKVRDANFLNSIQTLKHLHQSRWNELGHLGLFSDKRFEEFIIHVSEIFLNKGWLWFKEAKLNDKIIASRMAYKFKNKIYDYLSGFDNKHSSASFRPGITLIFTMIEDAISHNYKTVDFLRGAEEYKYEFSSDECNNYNIIIIKPDPIPVLKTVLIYLLKARVKLMFRIKTEAAIINLQIERRGKIMFLPSYFRFCLNRLKTFATKNKTRKFREEKIHKTQSVRNLPERVTRKNKKYNSQRMKESVIHSLQSLGSEDEIPAVKNQILE
ncbi:MAG: GNAT family N-acetyltransferase [Melioribacter sp.]|nr:GNAT family N-acetyltransferase [Melioribacter sp.]